MYTGITQGLFEVVELNKKASLLTYAVRLSPALCEGVKLGASVAIDGVCQTVMAINDCDIHFQAMAETLSRTTLSDLKRGDKVSVERSAKVGDENGGHQLAGHVMETGSVIARIETENNLQLTIAVSPIHAHFLVEKGFVAVDGSSLTVGNVDEENATFVIHLIPETRRLTNFDRKEIGSKVNIEYDHNAVLIAKMVAHYLKKMR